MIEIIQSFKVASTVKLLPFSRSSDYMLPPVVIHFHGIFADKTNQLLGIPHDYGDPHILATIVHYEP